MLQKGSASLVIISLVIVLALILGMYTLANNGDGSWNLILNSKEPTPNPPKDYSINRYSKEELGGILKASPNNKCVEAVLPIVHAFPGYKYQKITGTMRDGHIFDNTANVLISLTGEGLVGTEPLDDFSKDIQKDFYDLELYYDSGTDTCRISSGNIFNWLFPAEADLEAKELAKKEPVVQEFFTKYTNPRISYIDWLEAGRSEYSNNSRDLKYINGEKSTFVYLMLGGDVGSEQKHASRKIFVDLKSKRVIIGEEIIAPILPPQ